MSSVSACLIVRDEEANLGLCLAALAPFVDELCVLDTGSTDRTVAVAEAAGAVVGRFAWCDDFAAARNASLELATKEWVLVVDADELLDPESAVGLHALLDEAEDAQAFLVWIDNLREPAAAGGAPRVHSVAIPRLFRRRPEVRYERRVHESIMGSLAALGAPEPEPCALRLVHSGYLPEVVRARGKRERNLALLEAQRDPEDAFNAWKLAATYATLEREDEALAVLRASWERLRAARPAVRARLPFLPLVAAELARLSMNAGELVAAGAVLEEALDEAPGVSELLYQVGEWQRRCGRFELARQAYVAARTAGPWTDLYSGDPATRGVKPLVGLAKVAALLGDPGLARDALREALELAPGHREARALAARLRAVAGRESEAWQALGVLLEEAPGDGHVALLAAELAWNQGECDAARGFWTQAERSPATRSAAAAWQRIADLVEAGVAPAPDFPAADLLEAAARVVLDVVAGRPTAPEACLERGRLVEEVHAWLAELVRDPAHRALRAFQRRSPGYEGVLPGLARLLPS
ncbi:MAG: glycosyltransferase [Planctomycetes bacterium]|nr:glycosyltransferase [Planctomycetota bacterium]